MKEEYVIINKTTIQKGIEKWEIELQKCFKAPVGEFNSDYVSTLQQAITTAREILSQSTPLIPEIEKAFDSARETVMVGTPPFEDTEPKYKTLQDYLKNK